MKETTQQITSLATDIKDVFQKEYGDKVEMLRLCADHNKPLMHTDEKPVLTISQDDFVGIFNIKANHYFIPPDQVFRLGTYCRLSGHRIMAMMLKAVWEHFLSDMAGFPHDSDLEFGSVYNNQELITSYIGDFQPHLGKLYKLFKNDQTETMKPLPYDTFEFIAQDLLDEKYFLFENVGLERLYPEEDISERKLLARVPLELREDYQKAKALWLLKSNDLDNMLLLLEKKKKVNQAVENKYFEIFGKQETVRSDVNFQLEKYTLVLKIIEEQPDLSIREVLRLASKKLVTAENARSKIRNKIARSQNKIDFIVPQDSRSTASAEFRESYIEACTALLHKLYFMLHTDHCPGYKQLIPEQQKEIDDLWLEVMKYKDDELFNYSPTSMLYSMPDYEILESIYRKACQILDVDPEDFTIGNRLEFMINKGSTLESIMDFLNTETGKLSLHLAHMELVQNEYTNEDQCQVYRNALTDIAKHESWVENKIKLLKESIQNLRKQISMATQKIEMK